MDKENIFRLIADCCCEIIPALRKHEFKPDDRLNDLGANSVDRADIIMMTIEALSLQIPRVELFGTKNIGELVDVIYEKLQST
jgi:polyketide biosynthesis acyl carrier protein